MKKCIVLVSDENYIQHTRYLFSAIRFKGNWKGDYCLIANKLNDDIIKEFKSKEINVLKISNEVQKYSAKYYLFNKVLKNWDVVGYFDTDFLIIKDINNLLETDSFLADIDGSSKKTFTIGETLDKLSNPVLYEEASKIYNLDSFGFNSSCMIYNTSLIQDNTFDDIILLSNKYKDINHHTGPDGTDQPILNLYFQDRWKQIDKVSFHRNRKGNEIAVHTCRWEAPWTDPRYVQYYKHYLSRWITF